MLFLDVEHVIRSTVRALHFAIWPEQVHLELTAMLELSKPWRLSGIFMLQVYAESSVNYINRLINSRFAQFPLARLNRSGAEDKPDARCPHKFFGGPRCSTEKPRRYTA